MSDNAESIEIGEWRRVSPLSIAAQGVRSMGSAIIPIGFVLFGAASQSSNFARIAPYAIPILIAIFAINMVPAWLGWYRLRYRIGTSDVRLEQGIISRAARSVPYDRIQDVSLEQKLIPRLLGLVEVRFETGAGGKDEMKLAYVSEEEGERLRDVVRALTDGAEETSAAMSDEMPAAVAGAAENVAQATPDRLLFAMGQGRLFTYGLFSFSLVIFAVLLGAAQQFEFLLPFDVWDQVGSWFKEARYQQAASTITGLDTGARILAIVYLIASVIVVGLASGVVKTFVRDWGFRLERTAKGFRRRRGLLTRTDVVMPAHRVQALVLSTGIIRRRFGWHGLSFISLAQDAGGANHEVAPFARLEEIAPIAQEAGFTLPDETEEWRRPSPHYYFDRAVFTGLLVAVAGIFLFAAVAANAGRGTSGTGVIAAAIVGTLGIIVAREFYLWRYDRHALDPAQVLSRRGWLAPRTQVASRVKLHSVEIAQGPLARWRGYCDLHFGLAGGRLTFAGLALDDACKLRAAVLDSIAAVDFAQLPR